jgi:hypothetical protein
VLAEELLEFVGAEPDLAEAVRRRSQRSAASS